MRVFLLLSMRYHLGLSPQIPLWDLLRLFVLGQFLHHIRRQYFLQTLRLKLRRFLQFLERVNIDSLVLDVVSDGPKREPKEGLVHE